MGEQEQRVAGEREFFPVMQVGVNEGSNQCVGNGRKFKEKGKKCPWKDSTRKTANRMGGMTGEQRLL